MTLQVAPCSHEAAKYAVETWHYSQILPTGKIVKYGVWEQGEFVGAVLYGRGASPYLGKALNLDATEVCELVRVALRDHAAPVSQIVAQTLRLLRIDAPGLRVVVSFADPKEGHRGGIYQAGNWLYTGESGSTSEYLINGRWRHRRGAYSLLKIMRCGLDGVSLVGGQNIPHRITPGKYRYLYPLDKQMRRRIAPLCLPYPHAVEGSEESRIASGDEGQVRSLPTALG